jgi:iodothyronine deiodinase-like protein
LGALHELWKRHRDQVEFLVVYIREAHPEDGWILAENRREGIALRDPESDGERADVAKACATRLAIRMPVLADAVDDRVASAYGAWPDRLYLIGRDGRIAFQGGEGPFGFVPEELAAAIESELACGRRS